MVLVQPDLLSQVYKTAVSHGRGTAVVLGSTLLDSIWLEVMWSGEGFCDFFTASRTVLATS